MSDTFLDRLREAVLAAAELAGADREECLDRLCAGDPALRAEAVRLLASDTRAIAGVGQAVVRLANSLTEAAALALPEAGSRLGPYQLLRRLGAGGSGTVFEAQQETPLRRRVAIKFLHRERPLSADRARFRAEQQILAGLDHPNIARVFDAGTTPAGVPYFVLEFVDGAPLTAHATAGGLDLDARLRLCLQACRAAEHAHAKGVIHRDLKPSNILVAAGPGGPQVKIIDFGIARLLSSGADAALTLDGLSLGTPAYMSPEQACGSAVDCDVKTDVHALGNLLQELAAGRGVYDLGALSTSAQLRAVAAGRRELAVLAFDGRRLPADLRRIIAVATEPEPARRYSTVAALADDLERYLAGFPIAARRASPAYVLRMSARRHPVAATLACALAAVVLGGLVLLANAGARERRAALTALRSAERTEALAAYLQGVMAFADPANLGPQATMAGGLAEAARRADLELAGDPDLRVRVLVTIAEVLHSVGNHEFALTTLDRIEPVLAGASGLPPTLRLDARLVRARALRSLGRRAVADSLAQGVMAEARGVAGLERQEAAAWVWLADHRLVIDDFAGGDSAATRALELLAGCPQATREETVSATRIRATCLANLGRREEASALLRAELAACERELSPTHRLTLLVLSALAYVNGMDGGEDALAISREVLDRASRVLPPDHLDMALYENNLASVLMERGQAREAQPHLARAVAAWRRRFGDDHPHSLIALNNLGYLCHVAGDLDEAARCYERALAGMESQPGSDMAAQILNTRANLGAALLVAGRAAEAATLLEAGLAQAPAALREHANAGYCHYVLGLSYLARERPGDAVASLREAIRISQTVELPGERTGSLYANALGLALLGSDPAGARRHLDRGEAWLLGPDRDRHLRLYALQQTRASLARHGESVRAEKYAARARELAAAD